MKAKRLIPLVGLLLFGLACNLSSQVTPEGSIPVSESTATSVPEVRVTVTAVESQEPGSSPVTTSSPAAVHLLQPSDSPAEGRLIHDVESSGTAPEKRAPYGDSYRINRFERPFLQDMTYVPDMDIVSYNISSDDDWFYVSIQLIGNDPNNELGINFGVEIDLDRDGFGDYIIWGRPPFTTEWSTGNVQVFTDENHDTGGLSGEKSDAPLTGDGYETMLFSGGEGDADPDLAWARIAAGPSAQVQFAFKKSLPGPRFMLGVLSDAGLKDVTRMDYNDRFTAQEAGSPTRDNQYYPLQSLFAVDNVCRTGFGFSLTGNEPQSCPVDDRGPGRPPEGCPAPPGCLDWDPVACVCNG